jgi:hypothetical protein
LTKVVDFAFSRFCQDEAEFVAHQVTELSEHTAPEILRGEIDYDASVDVFSFGSFGNKVIWNDSVPQGFLMGSSYLA